MENKLQVKNTILTNKKIFYPVLCWLLIPAAYSLYLWHKSKNKKLKKKITFKKLIEI